MKAKRGGAAATKRKRWRTTKMIKKELMEILACPQCKGPVELQQEQDRIVCRTCRLVFAIRDDIPIMLIDQSIPLAQVN